MLKINNRFAFHNPFVPPKPIHSYVSEAFNPLPPLRSRMNDILSLKLKKINISSKIKKDEIKLPPIKREIRSEPVVERNGNHTKTSLLRLAKLSNGNKTKTKHKNYKKFDFESKSNDIDNEDDDFDVKSVELSDTDDADNNNNNNNDDKDTKTENDTNKKDNNNNDIKKDILDEVISEEENNSDSETEEVEKHNVVPDLRREQVKNRFRKAILANRSIARLKEDNILLNMKKSNDNEEDPFTSENDDTTNKIQKIKNIRFGSSLSEDGNYTMLKCYEDMLCNEIKKINPKIDFNEISRTKTSTFIRLPRKFDSTKKNEMENTFLMSMRQDGEDDDVIEMKKHKIRVSKQLEKAMVLADSIKKKKGELVTSSENIKNTNINNIVKSYKMWTTNWKKIIS